MEKFKAGDKFIPRKPKGDKRWVAKHNKYEGKTFTVFAVLDCTDTKALVAEENNDMFVADWCEKVFIGVDTATGQGYSVTSEVKIDLKIMADALKNLRDVLEEINLCINLRGSATESELKGIGNSISDVITKIEENQFPEVGKKVEPMKAGIEGISENMVEGLKQYFKNTSKEEVLKVWEATKEEDFPIYNHIKASTLLPQPQTLSTEIDWEQRKWEASVAMTQGLLASGLVSIEEDAEVSTAVSDCIRVANEMIKQLKQ